MNTPKFKWAIVGGDWRTPLEKDGGKGIAATREDANKQIYKWICEKMPELKDQPYWRFVKTQNGRATIIDFGSHHKFALVEGKEDAK